MGLVKTKKTGRGLRVRGVRKSLQEKDGDMNLENICMCLYLEKRDKLFRKNKRS